jgi:hypothetical protein
MQLHVGLWYGINNINLLSGFFVRRYLVLSLDHDHNICRIMWDDGGHQDIDLDGEIVKRSFGGWETCQQ